MSKSYRFRRVYLFGVLVSLGIMAATGLVSVFSASGTWQGTTSNAWRDNGNWAANGTLSETGQTDATGVVTVSIFTANTIAGCYTVSVTSGTAPAQSIRLTNTMPDLAITKTVSPPLLSVGLGAWTEYASNPVFDPATNRKVKTI